MSTWRGTVALAAPTVFASVAEIFSFLAPGDEGARTGVDAGVLFR
jgi:hypothetical protein